MRLSGTYALDIIITGAPRGEVPDELKKPEVKSGDDAAALGEGVFIDVDGAHGPKGTIWMSGNGPDGMATYRDLPAAMRASRHVYGYYEAMHRQVLGVLYMCQDALMQTWFVESTDAVRVVEYTNLVNRAIEELEGRQNGYLDEAIGILERAATLYDVLDRWNPLSRAAMMCAVLRRINAYQGDIDIKMGRATARDKVLAAELERIVAIFHYVTMEVMEMSRWWLNGREVQGPEHAARLGKRMAFCADMLDQIEARPYSQLAFRTANDLRKAANDMARGQMDMVLVYLSCVLQAVSLANVYDQAHEAISVLSITHRRRLDFGVREAVAMLHGLRPIGSLLQALDDSQFVTPVRNNMLRSLGGALVALRPDQPDVQVAKVRLLEMVEA